MPMRSLLSFIKAHFVKFFNICQIRPLFVLFSSFSQYNDKCGTKFDDKSMDGVLGNRTRECRIVGVDESTEL